MIEQKIKFYSDGIELDGAFFTPEEDNASDTMPMFIVCSGFTGLKNIHPERFARALTPRGFTVFGFDYRGFGASEGVREKVLIEEQVRDIANAVQFVQKRAKAEGRKLILAGWGMAGGLILDAAKLVDGIDGLVSMNGFFDSVRVQKALRGDAGWNEFRSWMSEERARLAEGGEKQGIDPFDIYPLDPVSREYVDSVLRKNPDYGVESDFDFADSLLSFQPEKHLDGLGDIPLLIAHGAENALHPTEEAEALFGKYPGEKELYWQEGAGHTEWMLDENPLFKQFSSKVAEWAAKQA